MTDIVFGENEGVLLQTTDVYRYSGKREFEVKELYLTNKNLLIIYENNRLDRIPLFSVRVVNGIVQVSQIEDDEYGTVLQLIYTNGRRDLFDLNGFGRKYTTWISAISDAVLSLVNEKSDASSSDIIDVNNAKDEITKHTAKSLCDNCGAEIYVTAKFCPECGTQRKEGNSQRRVVYDGVIHKCPICGDVLDSFKLKCDACGYELRGIKSSAAVQDFVAEIRR